MNNNLYDENRRFKNVFPDFNTFKLNTQPYIFDTTLLIDDNLEIIYNRLKLQYNNSFFAYRRRGTIYNKNVEMTTKLLMNMQQYERVKELADKKINNEDITDIYDTDNEEEADVVGSLTNRTKHTASNTNDYNKILNKLNGLTNDFNKLIEQYQMLLLNDIIYKRGEIYDY